MEDLGNGGIGDLSGDEAQLRHLLSGFVLTALEDASISDVLVNPDGSIWVERLRDGRRPVHLQLRASDAAAIVHGMAALFGTRLQVGTPILSAALPVWNAHFTGVVPPLVRAPAFAIHKFSGCVRSLEDYVVGGLLSAPQACALRHAVQQRRNIVISGGRRSGKTTLANALLLAMGEQTHRVLVLERTPQLRCTVPQHIPLRAWSLGISLETLLRKAFSWRPDRLVVGDLEGRELPALLRAWQDQCPGGLATTAAGSARSALVRMEEVLRQMNHAQPRAQVACAVHVLIQLQGTGSARRVTSIAAVLGADGRGYRLRPLAEEDGV